MDDFLAMFPPKLARQMRAAGVTGPSSLIEILQDNQALEREFARYAQKHPEVLLTLSMGALLEQFLAAETPAELLAVYLAAPLELRAALPMAVTEIADAVEADGNEAEAEALRDRLDELEGMIAALDNPLVAALGEFIRAPDEQTARRVYRRRHRVLQTIQAQRVLDGDELMEAAAVPEEFEARRELLRELRAAGSLHAPRHRLARRW